MQALTLLASAALFLLSTTTSAATSPALKLWRLDCGVIQEDDLNLYSDTYAYVGKSKQLSAGCYQAITVIQHERADIAKLPAFPAYAE